MTGEDNKQTSDNEPRSEKLTDLSESVDKLYNFRDRYFETHSVSEACNKAEDVKKLLAETLKKFDDNKDVKPGERAQYFYLKGKALNVTPDYEPRAEEALSRAIKLDIKLFEAWNELGESYWKKENISEAKNCFQGALKQKKNKKSLRNLSMVSRMEKSLTYDDKLKNVEEGIKFAKEAVELDPTDGISWSVLGNAYLSSFFNVSQHPTVLNNCKTAYTQAEKDVVAKGNPDLYYNKAIVAKYEEDYLEALNAFGQASKLEPLWKEPKVKQTQLLTYLTRVNELYRDKGKMKGKKLAKLLANLNPDKNLGPYHGGCYKGKNGQEVNLVHCDLNQLKEGLNEERVVLGVVVCSVQDEDSVPFTFIMVDRNDTTVVVTVYNLAQEKGVLIGDYVAIPEPYVTSMNIQFEDKDYSFKSIRVVSPLVLVVNGKKLDKSKQSDLQFSTFTLAD